MCGALGFPGKNFLARNDTDIATTSAGQCNDEMLVQRNRTDFTNAVFARSGGWTPIGDAAGLPRDALGGKPLTLAATDLRGTPRRRPALGVIQRQGGRDCPPECDATVPYRVPTLSRVLCC